MYIVVHVTLVIFIILRNNVKSVPSPFEMESTTMINPTTELLNSNDEQSIPFNDSIPSNVPNSSEPSSALIHEYWMTQMGIIKDDLLRIQAIIVKDEDAETACVEGNQKSKKRYLMCAGSILNRNRVLTSASCLHEAMHIRHNVRAPLAVIIAPLSSTVQMIRVAEYRIHPKHDTNPYSPNHSRHNLAILSLACRISSGNYNKILLPNQAMTHICTEENCFIAIYRKIGYTSNVMYQIPAPNIPIYNKKRRRSVRDKGSENVLENVPYAFDSAHDPFRIIYKRSTDGSNNCSQTGAPVMINSTQTAVVAVSCDDRQHSGAWAYTDLYINLNWIHSILHDWNKTISHTVPTEHSVKLNSNITESTSKTCGNCIFNFYISVGCKERGNCPKAGGVQSSRLSNINTKQHQQQLNVQSSNHNSVRAQNGYSSWKHGQISNNNVPRLLRSSFEKCPNNSFRCSIPVTRIDGVKSIIPSSKMNSHGVKRLMAGNEKIQRFMKNSALINAKNQSPLNGPMYNIMYHENGTTIKSSRNGGSRVSNKKSAESSNINRNIYLPIRIGWDKYYQNAIRNWSKRRDTITDATHRGDT